MPSVAPTVVNAKPAAVAPKPAGVWWAKYQGVNHVWMPTLGINRPVYLFPCSRGTDPDNLVYRWGCAGTNNVYLLGHAYGVFKPLHDAYYNGKLRVGMPVVYADGNGRERLYRVTTWRIVNPVDAAWAIASQPRPSMTLQTCVGADGSLRLNVRLVAVNS
ncbi:MAG TPA: sortase [Candidatus Limnocylindrales bacterium]